MLLLFGYLSAGGNEYKCTLVRYKRITSIESTSKFTLDEKIYWSSCECGIRFCFNDIIIFLYHPRYYLLLLSCINFEICIISLQNANFSNYIAAAKYDTILKTNYGRLLADVRVNLSINGNVCIYIFWNMYLHMTEIRQQAIYWGYHIYIYIGKGRYICRYQYINKPQRVNSYSFLFH